MLCLGPAAEGALEVREVPRQNPAADEVEIAVEATSVNPIDVRRAEGYGSAALVPSWRRQISDGARQRFCRHGRDHGTKVVRAQARRPRLRLETNIGRRHARERVLVKAASVLPAPCRQDLQALAAIPYSFVTMWLAVRGAGLTREHAAGKKVLVHGAAGGLGILALQMLSGWGAKVTAIAMPPGLEACRQAGATEVLDGTREPFSQLGRTFDATLNFATWDHDLMLVRSLRDGALGHATTVHPLMGNFDRYGWVRGGLRSVSEKKAHRKALPKGARNYAWTLFRPDVDALSKLAQLVAQQRLSLAIGIREPLARGADAFDHVKKGRPGRALLIPEH